MKKLGCKVNTVDEYIAKYPSVIRDKLSEIRQAILDNAPQAIESISYGMPAYKTCNKPLVYFGGFKNHIGFYATPTGHIKFKEELSLYKQGRGSVQFPIEKPIPLELIKKIVKYRVGENKLK